ncbi:MAG: MBL fold metallo-hydrolase [Acidobacteriaceae bacterium]|nr:MBL fold metallo-hydrolase [Acidobacteriaceae bacterium]
MEHVEVPAEQAIPMDAIARGVQGLRIVFVNVFGLTHRDGSWTLIDAGLPMSEGRIHNWAEKQFGKAPNAIFLTHGHFDHVSAARELADRWNVPIYAHPLEFPYLTGRQAYPPPNAGAGGGAMSLLSPTYPRDPIDLGARLRELPAADGASASWAELPDWEIVHTPGHTPGHVSLYRMKDGVLLPGDAFCTTKPESFFEAAMVQHPELHGPPAYFTSDWAAAGQSVRKLARLNPSVVAPGHGKPLSGGNVAEALRALAANFDAIAVPENKKGADA